MRSILSGLPETTKVVGIEERTFRLFPEEADLTASNRWAEPVTKGDLDSPCPGMFAC